MKKYTSYIFLVFIYAIFSCNNNQKINFKYFTLTFPREWKKQESKGVDSNTGVIVTPQNDTIFYDLGYYSNSLTEKTDFKIYSNKYIDNLDSNLDLSKIIFADPSRLDKDYYIKQNVSYESKAGHLLKYIFPRKTGVGITGLYIDSLTHDETIGNLKFSIYGNNLKLSNQQILQDVIHNIIFEK